MIEASEGVPIRRSSARAVVVLAAFSIAGSSTVAGSAEARKPPPKHGAPVAAANVRRFAAEFDRTFRAAIPALIAQLGRAGARSGREATVATVLRSAKGSIRVHGVGITQPRPAHWDLTLTFGSFSAPAAKGKTPLRVSGALQLNVVTPGRAALGLFRGFLTLAGAFGGSAEVVGEVSGGKVVALVVTSRGRRLTVGRVPRTLVSYVGTVAGGKTGRADGFGSAARFDTPEGVAVARDGRIYVADRKNNALRAITPAGRVTTLVRGLVQPTDVGLDGSGTLIATADSKDAPLSRVDTGSGVLTPLIGHVGQDVGGFLPLCQLACDGFTPLAGLPRPSGLDVEGGVIFIAQPYPKALRLATRSGSIHTLSNLPESCAPTDVAKGLNGDLYFVAQLGGCYAVTVMHSDGSFGVVAGKPTQRGNADGTGPAARFFNPTSLAFDGVRYLYVADNGNQLIRRVDVLTKEVVTVAGCRCNNNQGFRNGPGVLATFSLPRAVTLDSWGDLYVADEQNAAVRVVRVVTDPARDPHIRRFEPYALLRGTHARLTVTGENLGLTQTVSLGAGINVKIAAQSGRTLLLDVTISAAAPAGPHTLSVKTFYGKVQTPPGLSLQVLDQNEPQITVSTIAGTGSWSPGFHDGPAIKQPLGFPAGMAALDSGRIVVADPLEQRLRFVGSKDGTERELVQLLLDSSGSSSALGAALAPLGTLGTLLNGPVSALIGRATSALLLPIVKAAVDQYCASIGDPCAWIELPWAGTIAPGQSEGFRMSSLMFLPVDVAATETPGVVFAADTGNSRTRSIGLDPRNDPATKSPANMFTVNAPGGHPFGVADAGGNAMDVSLPERHTIVRMDLKNRGVKVAFAGNDGSPGCEDRSGAAKHPLGLPLGLDATKDDLFAADPFCATVWKISKKDGSVKDMRGPLASLGASAGSCSDGPVAFATFGAPVDVAVDKDGTIWVADAGCNSIREIKDVWADKESSAIAGALKSTLGGLAGRLPGSTVDKIKDAIDSRQPDFIEANRWWVITVAGSREGAAGYRDGLAEQSLLSGPMGIGVAAGGGGFTYVFVSDSGNKRVRLLTVPG